METTWAVQISQCALKGSVCQKRQKNPGEGNGDLCMERGQGAIAWQGSPIYTSFRLGLKANF